ncbi:MAG: hypothetical protein PHF50_01350 [Patescibacteria group bacterium]|nr:hypothetical protein [Patescibacteria group bacterium]
MAQKVSVIFERKIATNGWIIKTRWFYMVGVLIIGILTKTISQSNVGFPFIAMVFLFLAYALINLMLYFAHKSVEKNFSKKLLYLISYTQIIVELAFFTIIMHSAGGIESISTVFFFLPVVSASLIFGSRGSIITAVAAGLLINLLILAEYYGVISHIDRYNVPTLEFQSLPIALTKTITTSIFFVIIGSFSGYGASMLFKREKSFEEKKRQLDEQTKQVVKRSRELAAAKQELDNKVVELRRFQQQTVGRELKMIELKNKIKKLESRHDLNNN